MFFLCITLSKILEVSDESLGGGPTPEHIFIKDLYSLIIQLLGYFRSNQW